MNAADPTIWLAFAAGFLSFISPCSLPLYPSYLSYITGISVAELRSGQQRLGNKAMIHTLFFMLGFSIIFISLGLSATLIGSVFLTYQSWIRQIGGILIIFMGLFMIGLFQKSFLIKEKRFNTVKRPTGYLGSSLIGVTFAAGWTPCVGPILTSVLLLSASTPSKGIWLILAYTLGFSVPFFIMSFFLGRLKVLLKYSQITMKIGGSIMIVVGVLLYTGRMTDITNWFIQMYGGFTGF